MKTKVINSRDHKKTPQVWRRRTCERCHQTTTTYERVSLVDELIVRKDNGLAAPYNPGILLVDLHEALLRSDDEAAQNAYWLCQSIEDDLATLKQSSITTDELKVIAHEVLSRFNTLTGIQYAAKHQLLEKIKRPRSRG